MHKIIILKTVGNNNQHDGTCIGNSDGNKLTIRYAISVPQVIFGNC